MIGQWFQCKQMSAFCPSFYCVRKVIAYAWKADTLQMSAKLSFDGQIERHQRESRIAGNALRVI